MASLLEGQLAAQIFKGFKGKLLKGTLARSVPSDMVDSHGDPISTAPATFPCEGFVESFSAFYRQQAGIPETDVSILIFVQSITTEPTKDDIVTFRSSQYQIRKMLEIDPAVATYRLQGYQV